MAMSTCLRSIVELTRLSFSFGLFVFINPPCLFIVYCLLFVVCVRADHGRVEVYVEGQWSTAQELRDEEATVICKQLGFPNFYLSLTSSDSSLTELVTYTQIYWSWEPL